MKDKWISVKEELPPINRVVLLNIPAYRNLCTGSLNEDGTWEQHNTSAYGQVTHWMPLPKPPKK